MNQICVATRHAKIRYDDEDAALRALEDASSSRRRRRGMGGVRESRVYECAACGGWHLTHAPPRH